jgi:Putative zinc-binding metallo-peptidase
MKLKENGAGCKWENLTETLLGHVRHEVGHHYWDLLVRDGGQLDACREVFGDDTVDYGAALRAALKLSRRATFPPTPRPIHGKTSPKRGPIIYTSSIRWRWPPISACRSRRARTGLVACVRRGIRSLYDRGLRCGGEGLLDHLKLKASPLRELLFHNAIKLASASIGTGQNSAGCLPKEIVQC